MPSPPLVAPVSAGLSVPLLDAFLRRAATDGERAVAWLRLGFTTLALANLLILADGVPALATGAEKQWIMVLGLLASAAVSAWMLRVAASDRSPRGLLYISVVLDAALILLQVGCAVVWPAASYRGMLAMPAAAAFTIALAASGFRLSMGAVAASAVANLGGAGLLLAWDFRHNAVTATIPVDDIGFFWVLAGGALLLAVAMVQRTRVVVWRGAQAAVDAERARQRLGVYVSTEFAEASLAEAELRPGGDRRTVAVLFSDLRGFTRYGERLPPEQLVRELNAYLDAMFREIRAEGGVVDKYIGDAIMVVFGIPVAGADDAARALRAAAGMQRALVAHNAARARDGLPPLRQGIGVHYGDVVAGNIGTLERLQYTVIGDVVNLASRLETATKELGVDVLVSHTAATVAAAGASVTALAPGIRLEPRGALTVRGHDEPLEVLALHVDG
jgi:class 3 adenylate cyclase